MLIGPLPFALLSAMASVPMLVLLGGLVVLGWSVQRAAIVAFGSALFSGVAFYGLDPLGGLVAVVKGGLLSFFVLPILWAALFLHTLLGRLGAVDTIGAAMVRSAGTPAVRALLIGWGFSGFIQGFAGAGAPVASVVPLLQAAGFNAVSSASAAMVGHSWAITFGSMGTSYFAIQLVTRIPGEELVPWLGALFVLPIVATGLAVLHILLGWSGVRTGGPAALGAGLSMAAALWATASLGAAAVASIVAALVGCVVLLLSARAVRLLRGEANGASPHSLGGLRAGSSPALEGEETRGGSIHMALLPYYLLVGLTLAVQAGPLAPLTGLVMLGADLPGTVTALGYQAPPEVAFPRLRLFQHPATIIGVAMALTGAAYGAAGRWPSGALWGAITMTYRRSTASSAAVLFMVMMALVMADAGMISALASGLRSVAGPAFPLLSPLLGVLGSLMTGANTNSNVAMGALQVETAAALGLGPALFAAAQSVGGSLGAGVSPDKAAIGATAAGASGQEAAIVRRALPYALGIAGVVGLEVLIFSRWPGLFV